jgi:dTDP-4-dehydrorhamnose 3,5-epimerase
MKAKKCSLDGILLIEPSVYADDRGFFLESFESKRYRELGIKDEFIQDNHSRSVKNVLRGLHFTRKKPQAQILTVMRGKIFDVVVDIRKDSLTFGKWMGTELSDEGLRQIYMAHGFAHGFYVLSDYADLHYKVSQQYEPSDEGGLLWNDENLGIKWPVLNPTVSARDQAFPTLNQLENVINNHEF